MIRKGSLALALAVGAAGACSSSSSSRLRDADAAAGTGGIGGGARVDGAGGSAASGGSGTSGASGASGGPPDASGGSLGVGDDAATSRCNRSRPFDAPRPLEGVNSPADETLGWMSPDGLTFYFGSLRSAQGADIYRASRNLVSDVFSMPVALPAPVNSAGDEGDPKLSSNGLTLFFSRGDDIYVATRPTAIADFTNVGPVSNVNSTAGDWVGSLSESGERLYFQTTREGASKIYVAVLGTSGSFGMPTPVGELNSTSSQDIAPTVTPDTLTIYFGSTRSAAGTKGAADIFVAHRSTTNDGFGAPAVVPELNSAINEAPSWVSADDCEIILTRRSTGVPTERDYFIAARPK